MNQVELDQIKTRAQAALPDNSPPDMDKVRAMAKFRQHAAYDVLDLVAEVERLRANWAKDCTTTVCLCGSTRFFEAFQKANLEETLARPDRANYRL